MEKQLFDALIAMCTLMCTNVPHEYYKGHPLWSDVEKAIKEYIVKYPGHVSDINYQRVRDWQAAKLMTDLNPSNSGSLKSQSKLG